jgi:hypothetical protein
VHRNALNQTTCAALIAVALACGSSGDGECNPRPTAECPERLDDETGYAQLVCQYAVQNGYDYPDVAALNIVSVEKGSVAGSGSEYGTDRYDWARLDCCFAGDVAVIDRAECKVVEIHLAPE